MYTGGKLISNLYNILRCLYVNVRQCFILKYSLKLNTVLLGLEQPTHHTYNILMVVLINNDHLHFASP